MRLSTHSVLPEVEAPTRRIPLRERALYSVICLFIFLVCSQLPLYGIHKAAGSDPLYWLRAILASNRGTCMELGISPIVTSGLVMQLLSGSGIIHFDSALREDRKLLDGAFVRGIPVDIVQTATGVQYQG